MMGSAFSSLGSILSAVVCSHARLLGSSWQCGRGFGPSWSASVYPEYVVPMPLFVDSGIPIAALYCPPFGLGATFLKDLMTDCPLHVSTSESHDPWCHSAKALGQRWVWYQQ